jgi:hypothetical protein
LRPVCLCRWIRAPGGAGATDEHNGAAEIEAERHPRVGDERARRGEHGRRIDGARTRRIHAAGAARLEAWPRCRGPRRALWAAEEAARGARATGATRSTVPLPRAGWAAAGGRVPGACGACCCVCVT